MKPSKLAIALLLAIATNAAVAATDTKWYEAGERQLQSQEQTQQLQEQGFEQYAD